MLQPIPLDVRLVGGAPFDVQPDRRTDRRPVAPEQLDGRPRRGLGAGDERDQEPIVGSPGDRRVALEHSQLSKKDLLVNKIVLTNKCIKTLPWYRPHLRQIL